MITQTKDRNVTVSATESATFSISNNAKIFRILIDGLYADKIQSITREIWSNALDAHVQAGCADRPFTVSFPTPFDPTFRVRDYGVSLEHDQVMHMYTDLGNSTKEDTNDAVGKFGIGSKSPFAYTDNFTVTVYLDGTVRFYSAMIGKDGVPAIHLMAEQPTEEENGVEVAFPVEASDANAFQKSAKRVSHGFDVKPHVENTDNFHGWPELPVLLEGDRWKLLHGAIEGYSERAYARMGPVLYPINVNALGDLTAAQREIMQCTFVIDFAMGDLEITASREELSYGRNDPTTASILARVDGIVEGLTEECLNKYAECDSYFGACALFREQINSPQIPIAVRNIIKETAQWNGEKLVETPTYHARQGGWQMSFMDRKKVNHKVYRYNSTSKVVVPASPDVLIILEDYTEDDNNKRASTRIKSYVETNARGTQHIMWLRIYDVKRANADLMRFFDMFDGVEVVRVGDLPMPVANRSGSYAPRRPVEARILRGGDFDTRVTMTAEDFDRGGIYVPLERMQPQVPEGMTSPHVLFARMIAAKGIDQPVYGAPKSMAKKFAGEQWVNFYDYANDWYAAQNVDYNKTHSRRTAVQEVLRDDTVQFFDDHIVYDALAADSAARMVRALRDEAIADRTPNMDSMKDVARALGIDVEIDHNLRDPMLDELELVHEAVRIAYPMMSILVPSNVEYYEGVVDRVTEYVVMCDGVLETNQQDAAAA